MAFVKIIAQSQLPKVNEAQDFSCDGKMICIANILGHFSAMDNVCLHQGGSLGQGTVDKGKVVCPWHGWRYDPKTGEAEGHADLKVKIYPMKVENGEVFVDL